MALLIYDCDGVLVDSEPLANAAMAELMTVLGHPMTTEQSIRLFSGFRIDDVLRRAEQILGRPIPPTASADAGRRLLEKFRRELKPVAGAAAAIAALPYPRCVASSSESARLTLSLEVTGLAPLFGGHVFSAMQVANGKPAPDLFLLAARSMGETASRSIVIEDTVLGIAAAKSAGMTAIGFTGASHRDAELAAELAEAGADCVVASMSELPGTVEQVLAQLS
jgi:HAD superfamily hydrolase (TIGR01509 family)